MRAVWIACLFAAVHSNIQIAKVRLAPKALSAPNVKARFDELSVNGIGDTPENFALFCRSESERYSKIIEAASIRLE